MLNFVTTHPLAAAAAFLVGLLIGIFASFCLFAARDSGDDMWR